MSPTQRALALCRKNGWTVGIAERWNSYAKVRQDLFGFADLVLLDGLPGVLAVQVTSGSNASKRVAKLSGIPAVRAWLQAQGRVQVWSFTKPKRTGRWALRVQDASLEGNDTVAWAEVSP